MISLFRKLRRDQRGNVLAITAACMPLVIGAAGLATDTVQWTLWKRQLQRAADSAAIAGVYDRESATAGSNSNTPTAVCNDLAINLHTWMKLLSSTTACGTGSAVGSYDSISYPADSGSKVDQVQVTLKVQRALPFSSFFSPFGFTAPVITASATAASITTGTPCMMALAGSGTGIDNIGNATVNAPTCIFYSDSASTNSAVATGSSSVTVKAIAAVGSIAQSNNWRNATYMPNSPSLPDPFLGITPDPSQMHCSSSALDKNTNFPANSTTNCWSSITTSPHDVINVPASIPVVYVNGGNVDLKGSFNCTCTVVLTNTDPSPSAPIGTWSSNAQGNNNITAPTTGTYKGIAVYQDRRSTGQNDIINGGSNNTIQGVVYFPNDTLTINGTGEATSLCSMWVAKYISFIGTSDIKISSPDDSVCSGAGLPSVTAVKMVRLVA